MKPKTLKARPINKKRVTKSVVISFRAYEEQYWIAFKRFQASGFTTFADWALNQLLVGDVKE